MKKIVWIIIVSFAPFFFNSCSQEKEVKTAAVNYLTALKNFDLDEAKKYGTANAVKFLEIMQNDLNQFTSQETQKMKEMSKSIEVVIEKTVVKDKKATVVYSFQEKGKTVTRKETLNLIKQDGKWLADEDESW